MSSDEDETEQEPFTLPKGLEPPEDDIALPTSAKQGAIIDKTAKFVAENGPQMEIIIKTRQTSKIFGFLDWEHPQHRYYQYVVERIKSGDYKPLIVTQSADEQKVTIGGDLVMISVLLGVDICACFRVGR